jgi:hypothetical protein
MNALADADPETMRISIDTKATVNVGEYSRGGRSRGVEAVKALDHDMCPKENLPAYPVKPQSATQMDSLGVPSHRHTVHGK